MSRSVSAAARRVFTDRRFLDAVAVLVAIVLGVAAFGYVARGAVTVGPATLELELTPTTRPLTVVDVPPLGSIEARTHSGPLQIRVHLHELDVEEAQRLVETGEISVSATRNAAAARDLPGRSVGLFRIIARGLFVSTLAAALIVLALRRRPALALVAALVALALTGGTVGLAAASWDAEAFLEPTLRGSLAYAPQLIDVVSTRIADIDELRTEAVKVADSLAAYYADDRAFASGGSLPGTYRVLHVTDLHLDPVGAELARSIARSYETSLVIDTGDLPVLGSSVESEVFGALIDTSVPRVYVAGNHDSPESVAELRNRGVTVIESQTVTVDGLRIFGVPDPIGRGFGVEPNRAAVSAAAADAFERLERALESGEATPDVVAIHNPAMERPFVGTVPVIISGHTHSARMYVSRGTVRLNSGTLGGMPYDPEQSDRTPLPYSASVLYFTAELPRRLIAVDRIAVYPTRSTTVTRDVIDEALLP